MIADDNRRKKLMLPQPKEEKTQVENLKEITRLRRMAPLRGEEVKVRFHLDRRCSSCRRFEHVLVSDIEGFCVSFLDNVTVVFDANFCVLSTRVQPLHPGYFSFSSGSMLGNVQGLRPLQIPRRYILLPRMSDGTLAGSQEFLQKVQGHHEKGQQLTLSVAGAAKRVSTVGFHGICLIFDCLNLRKRRRPK